VGKLSRDKGKRGEREARDQAKEYWGAGDDCIRAAQACGAFAADVLNALPNAHLEVKRYKGIAAVTFLLQADDDRQPHEFPVVVMRPDNVPEWACMFWMKDSAKFVEAYLKQQEEQGA
jgi:hypothetical protein